VAKLNLLMLNYEFPPIGGGAANAHFSILKQYVQNPDLKIDVLTSAPKRGFYKNQFSENITIYRIGVNKKNLHHWRKIEVIEWLVKARHYYRQLLENNNYNLVHAFFGFPTGWLCYRSVDELPYIISLRGSDVPGQHARLKLDYKILAPVFRRIWENADVIIANSSGLKNRALKFLPSVLIEIIPNGVDRNFFRPAENKPRDIKIKLLTVGRLSVTKRVEMLIDAVRILRDGGFNVHLSIVGGGALQNRLKYLVTAAKLDDRIEFIGRVEQEKMPQIYQQSDIFVSATLQEGMSNAMLEAMACGLPIVTTTCEGIEELIADNGIVVGQPSAQAIADAVKSIVENEQLYNRMCTQARIRAEQFNWKNVADQYLQMYFNVKRRYTLGDTV
jgi:glycosyltransferase involved in cell wall biosynthesis